MLLLLRQVLPRLSSAQTASLSSKIWERRWKGFWHVIWRPNARRKPKKRLRNTFPSGVRADLSDVPAISGASSTGSARGTSGLLGAGGCFT